MSDIFCPLCGSKIASSRLILAKHFVECGTAVLADDSNNNNNASPISPPLSSISLSSPSSSLSPLSSPPASPPPATRSSPRKRNNSKSATPKSKKAKDDKKDDINNNNNNNNTNVTTTIVATTTTTTTTATTPPTKGKKAKKVTMTEQEYDEFLKNEKAGRFKRVGKWNGFGTGTEHKCMDDECGRTWKPAPEKCIPDDYYCPSCVLHHRNNVDRFAEPRLAWTAIVPNTFYVFSLIDPGTKSKLVKFGRTQHLDAWKRYPTKEVQEYKMELLMTLRGKLITMTQIENWWKSHAEENSLFCGFSDGEFHGATECLELDEKTLEFMKNKSNEMHVANP